MPEDTPKNIPVTLESLQEARDAFCKLAVGDLRSFASEYIVATAAKPAGVAMTCAVRVQAIIDILESDVNNAQRSAITTKLNEILADAKKVFPSEKYNGWEGIPGGHHVIGANQMIERIYALDIATALKQQEQQENDGCEGCFNGCMVILSVSVAAVALLFLSKCTARGEPSPAGVVPIEQKAVSR